MSETSPVQLDLSQHAYLLYDGDCGVCSACAVFARRLDPAQRFSITPYQTFAEVELLRYGISYADCDRGLQLILQTGRVYRSAFAVNRFLWSFWPWSVLVAVLYVIPILLLFEIWGYRCFANHRSSISRWLGLTACSLPAAQTATRSRMI